MKLNYIDENININSTYNNLKYLKCLVNSLKVNSFYEHELIVHVNEVDGTLDFVRKNNITYSFSKYNIGLCSSINEALNIVHQILFYMHMMICIFVKTGISFCIMK